MPPPGASAPAFAATAEPASCPPHAKHPKQDTSSTRDERLLEDVQGMCWGCVLKIGCFLHRFLISGPDLRIDASFSRFKPSCVHRFLISSPDLGIDASFSPFKSPYVHRFLISSPDLRIDARISPFKPSFVHRFLISGLDLRIDARGEWFRLQQLLRQRCPRPILISSRHRRMVSPATP